MMKSLVTMWRANVQPNLSPCTVKDIVPMHWLKSRSLLKSYWKKWYDHQPHQQGEGGGVDGFVQYLLSFCSFVAFLEAVFLCLVFVSPLFPLLEIPSPKPHSSLWLTLPTCVLWFPAYLFYLKVPNSLWRICNFLKKLKTCVMFAAILFFLMFHP